MNNFRTFTVALLSSVGLSVLAVGCAAERHDAIPKDANVVAQDDGDVSYRPSEAGMIYVYDRTAGDMLYSGRVRANEMVQVQSKEDRILIAGNPVMEKQIRDFNNIKIYFRESPETRMNSGRIDTALPAESTITRERTEIRTEPRSQAPRSSSDSAITIRPDQDRVTVEGNSDAKVTIEDPNQDQRITIERGDENRRSDQDRR